MKRIIGNIEALIYEIRGYQVILDRDLAMLYGVETKVLNQAVKRNMERFPEDFMFRLSKDECSRSQIVTLNTEQGKNLKYLPYAFTENGVAMLSGILRSDTAIEVNILIMRTFTSMRKMMSNRNSLTVRVEALEYNQQEIRHQQSIYHKRIDEVMSLLEKGAGTPIEGIFYDGQIFDAYVFASDLIRSARTRIVLIDNYVDDTIYHLGASLKDLGKKLFAFSKLSMPVSSIL